MQRYVKLETSLHHTFGNKRPGPLCELIIRTFVIFFFLSVSQSSSQLSCLNGIHLREERILEDSLAIYITKHPSISSCN